MGVTKGQKVAAGVCGGAMLAGLAGAAWLGRQPTAWQIPRGQGWYCFATATGGACTRDGSACVEQLARAGATPQDWCRPQATAWCYTWHVRFRATQEPALCFPTRARCEPFRAATALQPDRSTSVCGEVE